MRIVVLVSTVLDTLGIDSLPFGDPPMYPILLEPEQPEQEADFAPLEIVFEEASAS